MRRDLLLGLLWFGGLFGLDASSSGWELRKSLQKLDHAPDVTHYAQREIAIYVAQMMLAYLVMALAAGLVLHLLRRALKVERVWLAQGIFAGGVSLWIYGTGAIRWPLMFNGVPGLDAWASGVTPGQVSAVLGLAGALALLGLAARRRLRPGWTAALLVAFALAGHADAYPPARTPQKNQGLNVLIVGIDALRPDHLKRFGYARDTAPHLEAFLEQAAVFETAFTPMARTWGAWNSILTGANPPTHGERWSLPAPGAELAQVPLITKPLREAGYTTAFLTDDSRFSYFLPKHDFMEIDQPFVGIRSFATTRYQPDFRTFFALLNGPLGWAISPVYRYNQGFGITNRHDAFAERVADAIGAASQQDRFFMAVHTCLLHTPADRPYPYHKLYGMASYRGSNRYRYRSLGSAVADGDGLDANELERLERESRQQNIDLYDSGLAMVDEVFARITAALDEGDLWDNTLVIVLSDHGEDFLEEHMRYKFRGPNHGYHPWGLGQHRVLLAARGPGFSPGRRTDLASLIDVAPTIAAATGIALPSAEGLPLQSPLPDRVLYGETGVSEQSYWPPGHKTTPFRHASERYTLDPATMRVFQRREYDDPTIEAKDRWVLDRDFWLVEEAMSSGVRYSLFNWREDPTFSHNLAREQRAALVALREAIRAIPRFPNRAEASAPDLDEPSEEEQQSAEAHAAPGGAP